MLLGQFVLMKDFCSVRLMLCLSKLTYIGYLIAPIIMIIINTTQSTVTVIDYIHIIFTFAGHALMTLLIAFFLYLLVEGPLKASREITALYIRVSKKSLTKGTG